MNYSQTQYEEALKIKKAYETEQERQANKRSNENYLSKNDFAKIEESVAENNSSKIMLEQGIKIIKEDLAAMQKEISEYETIRNERALNNEEKKVYNKLKANIEAGRKELYSLNDELEFVKEHEAVLEYSFAKSNQRRAVNKCLNNADDIKKIIEIETKTKEEYEKLGFKELVEEKQKIIEHFNNKYNQLLDKKEKIKNMSVTDFYKTVVSESPKEESDNDSKLLEEEKTVLDTIKNPEEKKESKFKKVVSNIKTAGSNLLSKMNTNKGKIVASVAGIAAVAGVALVALGPAGIAALSTGIAGGVAYNQINKGIKGR